MIDRKVSRRILICGEVNPHGVNPKLALYHLPRHASGNKLREHLGLPDHVYAGLRKVNLCTGAWSTKKARCEVLRTRMEYDTRVVIMLGSKVRRAFWSTFDDQPPLPEWFTLTKRDWQTYVCLPHPSGLNRAWNGTEARHLARVVLRQVAPEIQWGALDGRTEEEREQFFSPEEDT